MNLTENDPGNSTTITYWGYGTRVALSLILGVVMFLSIIGNSMVILVITRHRGMRTRTNMFLCSLACADLLCAILDMPISLATTITGQWIFGATMCQINGFLVPFFFVASIHTLMYISIHKYISIKRPFSHILTHRHILLMIFGAWIWAAVVGYFTIHGLNTVKHRLYSTQCERDYPYNVLTYFYEGFVYGTCYVIPLAIMVFCYITMFQEIRRHALRMEVTTTTERDMIFLQQRRIAFTLFLVVVTFMLCWTPQFIYAACTSLLKSQEQVYHVANPIVYWFGYAHSACNPIIYALRSPAFREGYKQLLCKSSHTSTSTDGHVTLETGSRRHQRNDDQDTYSRPLGRFRQFLKETLGGTLHASGSFTGSPVASPAGSRKSSMTSLTNFLLFPKSRTLSTNSLPGNFRFSVQPLILDNDTTKVSFIAGIPVLTKGGKIVSYQNPHETPKRRVTPVYYPSRPQVPEKPANKDVTSIKVTEKSPLIPHSQSDTKVPVKLSPHMEIPEIFINMNDEEVDMVDIEDEIEALGGGDRPRLNPRNSCESGFNDVDHMTDDENEDQVFIVIADVEPTQPKESPTNEVQATTSGPQVLLGGELLNLPAAVINRQRVCKSVSDATDRNRPVTIRRSVKKSTSDTCIKHTKDMSTSCTDLENNRKAQQEKSIKKKILNRLFSKTKPKSTSSKSSSRSSQQDVHRHVDDDVSDSGMVSGFSGMHDSPSPGKLREDCTHHSFSGYDAKSRKSQTLDNREKYGHKTLALSRSSSDPSLSQSSGVPSKRQVKRVSRNRPNRSKRWHDKSKRRSRDFDQNGLNMNKFLNAASSRLQRSKSMKTGRYPSVEKLDRIRIGSDASALKKRMAKKNHSSQIKEEVIIPTSIDMSKFIDVNQMQVFHISDSRYLQASKRLHRSISDPSLTFKKIEEKVLQRSATKKWHRTKRGHRHRTAHAINFLSDNGDNNDDSNRHSSPHHDRGRHSKHTDQLQQNSSQLGASGKMLTLPTNRQFDEASPICQSNLSLDHFTSKHQQQQSRLLSGGGGGGDNMTHSALSLHRLSVDSCSGFSNFDDTMSQHHQQLSQSNASLSNNTYSDPVTNEDGVSQTDESGEYFLDQQNNHYAHQHHHHHHHHRMIHQQTQTSPDQDSSDHMASLDDIISPDQESHVTDDNTIPHHYRDEEDSYVMIESIESHEMSRDTDNDPDNGYVELSQEPHEPIVSDKKEQGQILAALESMHSSSHYSDDHVTSSSSSQEANCESGGAENSHLLSSSLSKKIS